MFDNLTTNIDSIISFLAVILTTLFLLYVIVLFIDRWRRHGIRAALYQFISVRVLGPLLVVVLVNLLSLAIVFVRPQEVGVVVSVVSPGGIRPQPLRSGLHWIIPFTEEAKIYPTYWQTYTMSGNPTEGAEFGDDSIRARTSDGQEVFLDCSIIFRISIDQAVLVHTDWQGRYVEDLIRPVVRGFVRTEVSQFTVNEVNSSGRKALEANLEGFLREELGINGLTVSQFLLRDITFSPEYAQSVEDKQIELEAQTQALYEAERDRRRARGHADAVLIEAQAQADALRLLADALAANPDLIVYNYTEKLAPNVQVMLVPNASPLILPLPELQNQLPITPTQPITGTTAIDTP